MKRVIAKITLITLVAAGFTTSCSDDTADPAPVPVVSEYENLTQRDHVLLNLSRAYNAMNINEYKRLFVDDFMFFFSQADFDNGLVAGSYRLSEGYGRTSQVLFDGKTFAAATLAESLSATEISRSSVYDVPGTASDITLRVDQFTILDDGQRLNFLQSATLGSNVDGVNSQSVFSSSLTGGRKIDVVISPSIFKKAGLLDN